MCNFAVRKFRDMYAIVEIAGQQFKVTNGQEIFVNRLQGEEGSKVSFDKVLLIDNEGATKVGTPTVAGANVEATINNTLSKETLLPSSPCSLLTKIS